MRIRKWISTLPPSTRKTKWREKLDGVTTKHGIVRFQYEQKRNGSWYTMKPNMQGFKSWMIAELVDDADLMSWDYSAMHPGVCGWLLRDAEMMKSYSEGRIYEGEGTREQNKAVLLQFLYGSYVDTTAVETGLSVPQIERMRADLVGRYPCLAGMDDNTRKRIRRMASALFNRRVSEFIWQDRIKIYLMRHDEIFFANPHRDVDYRIHLGDFKLLGRLTTRAQLQEKCNVSI